MNKQRGFTLIEIAIVLVIIGLLLGGFLKGQELIASVRVRNLIAQQDGFKAAYHGFADRFHALPGDYAAAVANINKTAAFGNGNGQVASRARRVSGSVRNEDIAVWDHLSKSGFISRSYTYAAGAYTAASAARNPYASFLMMRYDNAYQDTAATPGIRHNLKTGGDVPADLLAEIDRKIDDGAPHTGSFRYTGTVAAGTAPNVARCLNAARTAWLVQGSVAQNCAGATLL